MATVVTYTIAAGWRGGAQRSAGSARSIQTGRRLISRTSNPTGASVTDDDFDNAPVHRDFVNCR
jgi:hypothetical protein